MRLCTGLCAMWLMWLALAKADDPQVFCYYPSSPVARVGHERLDSSEIDPSLCTHLIYGFVRTTENGKVSVVDPQNDLPDNGGKAGFQKFNALRGRNKKLKTLISINGENSENFTRVISDTFLRLQYVRNVVDFVLHHDFDGVDSFGIQLTVFDDVRNYVLFLKELRAVLDRNKLILSVHVEGTEVDARWFYDIPEIAKYAHFVLLTVECHKSKDPITGHVAPLYPASREKSSLELTLNINASVHYWLDQGVPPKKLILGTPLYGNGFVLKNSAKYAPGSPASGEATFNSTLGHVGYKDICKMISQVPWTSVWDEEQRVPYSYAEDRWISYENVRSLTEKGKFAKTLGLGGVMAWTIDQDDYRGNCGSPFPLLNALNRGLREINNSDSTPEDLPLTDGKIVCFYRNWAAESAGYGQLRPSEIDPSPCTHLVYVNVGITESGNIRVLNPRVDLPDRRGRAGGGGHAAASTYSRVAADAPLRSKYVKNVIDFLLHHDFNGFNLYWEYPTVIGGNYDDLQNLVLLLKDLRAGFDKLDLILSVTVTAAEDYASNFYDIPGISKHVDFIVLLPQYRRVTDPVTGHWAPLYAAARETSSLGRILNINASVEFWLSQGAPANKLILGTFFDGLRFTLRNSAKHSPGSPAIVSTVATESVWTSNYNEICRLESQEEWTAVWDEEQRVPYIYSGYQWISYNNVRSTIEKGKYARAKGLGGVMAYSMDGDDHRGDCGERYPLLKALNCGFRRIRCSSVSTSHTMTSEDGADKDARRICAKYDLKYVRHAKKCAKFWICLKIRDNEYIAEPFSCGGGLYFDMNTNICKNKEMVQCG